MSKARIERLEARLAREAAAPGLLAILRHYRRAAGDDTPIPASMSTTDVLRALMVYLPN